MTLLTAKLAAYAFDQSSLCFIFSYLSERIQRAEVNNTYNAYTNIKYSGPQYSILDPVLFNIDVFDLFLWHYKCDITSYADDITSYTSDTSLSLVLKKLESPTHGFFGLFKERYMKANPDKCHFLVTTNVLTSLNMIDF